jgi:hypothetical protein
MLRERTARVERRSGDRVKLIVLGAGLFAVGMGLRGFWLLMHGRNPRFKAEGSNRELGPTGQWLAAGVFLAVGIVFVLAGAGVITGWSTGGE